ncbi:putative RNApII degradation factor def1 protein [Botryosphaeria dothidea]|uniref:RNA polymerase II degradation factor 1 n=1 Tax=Botryosphaeria dothidea TaxID=55169 RepID=A0A8H4IXF7_9PEZI|nr:putative RNApII degradation factor def1 protein [Botryosphaeria dothidea]
MSEVQSRPSAPRGRSSARGGRGGFSSRGPRSSKQTNGDHKSNDASAEEGELSQLKQQYATQLATIKETFPDWTDLDLLLALHESDGDLNVASEKILEGQISQFAEVPKKNDRARSKVKDTSASNDAAATSTSSRGRGRFESTRGGRGRGNERGRGGFRGSRGGAHAANGSRSGAGVSVPTTESSAWDATATTADANNAWDTPAPADLGDGATDGQGKDIAAEAKPAAAAEAVKKPAAPQEPPKKTWAQMFAKPKPKPAPPKPAAAAPPPEPAAPVPAVVPEPTKEIEQAVQAEELPIPPTADEAPAAEPPAPAAEPPVVTPEVPEVPSAQITPSKDELTKENVENLPDVAEPPPTGTAASTVASGSAKATAPQGRSASYQRKVLEQQEAVVMPGNHAVDRAAVQFGSLGLNGDAALDVDEDREEAETRTQPPQHSPTQQPRASLPPAPRQPAAPSESQPQDHVPTPKQAPGLPPVNQQPQQQSPAIGGQAAQPYSQFGRYGQNNVQSEPTQAQKPYDPFGAPVSQPNQFDSFPSHTQPQNIQQPQAPSSLGGFSSAPNDYSSYYTSDQQRNAYQNYYGAGYGQQAGGNQQQEVSAQEQRTGSGFGPTSGDSAFPTSQSQQTQSRYGDAQNSGHNTPAPTMAAQHHPAAQSQHMHQPHGQTGHSGFPYGSHPYYNSPYYNAYMNQFGGAYGGQGYGAPFGKGMYGQPHHGYGMSPQTTYDAHSSSPANVGGFGASSMHGRDSALGGGLGDYRTSSTQPSQTQQHTASSGAFGGMPDVFGRNQGVFPGQNQPYGQQQSASQAGAEDALKPFGEKAGAGPSPSSIGQPGRPGSATNSVGQGAQSGLPPPQSHQQGFGGYPGSQYGLGGLGGHQGGQSHGGGYGGYGAGFGSYGSYGRGGGWGGNYGH